jgi:hypothetical protein
MMAGASFAEYSNQDVTAKLKVSTEENTYFISTISIQSVFKTVANAETCAGFGVSFCTKIAEGGFGPGVFFDFVHEEWDNNDEESSTSMSFTFTYATSAQIEEAGRRSTMFLTPSLTIVFTKSLRVMFEQDICMATGTEVTTWSLGGTENFKV